MDKNNREKQKFKIAAGICSFNNRNNLKKLIQALLDQTYPLREIIVVDNASTDGTQEMLKNNFPQITLLLNQENLGVGGGYARAMDYVLKKGYDWIWLLDDDSLPAPTALQELVKTFYHFSKNEKIGILTSSPLNPITKKISAGTVSWRRKFIEPSRIFPYSKPIFVDLVISSGSLIKREVIQKVGVVREDFFMDFVDYEYSLRVRKNEFKIVFVPSSIIFHSVGKPIVVSSIPRFWKKRVTSIHAPWRLYYMTRNDLYTHLYLISPHPLALMFCFYRLFRIIARTLVYSEINEKLLRIKYIFLGLKDGFLGRLGIKVIPPSKE